MPLIQWDDSFSVGFEEIDAQHQRWVQLINNLDDALEDGDPDELALARHESLKAMVEYVCFHFSFEEGFMAKMGYPELKAHRELHDQMRAKLLQIQCESKNGYHPLNTQLMSLLVNWLKDHILTQDKRYAAYSAENETD